MKILKIVGVVAVLLVAVFVGGGYLMRPDWKVQRAVVTSAKPEHISDFITEPAKWVRWAAWNSDFDPEAKWVYFGARSGVGAKMAWNGPKLGRGLLTITAVEPTRVRYQMQMEGRLTLDGENTKMEGGSPSSGEFSFVADGERTRVTWLDTGHMGGNLAGRWFIPMMEKMLGEHFEIGLQNLKKVSEEAAAAKAAAPPLPAHGATPVAAPVVE